MENQFPFSGPLDLAGRLLGAEVDIRFISYEEVEHIHLLCVNRYGGSHGVRDDGLVRSALGRPMQIAAYQENATMPELAAALCAGIAKNHGFIDGNKRTALFATAFFLEKNGLSLVSDTADTVFMMKGISSGEISEEELRDWIGHNTVASKAELIKQGRPKPR